VRQHRLSNAPRWRLKSLGMYPSLPSLWLALRPVLLLVESSYSAGYLSCFVWFYLALFLSLRGVLETHGPKGMLQAQEDQPIPSSNIGSQMLERLGWRHGEGLGLNRSNGILEPLPASRARSAGKAGLGMQGRWGKAGVGQLGDGEARALAGHCTCTAGCDVSSKRCRVDTGT
jgi:hypothetical protein